MEEKLRVAREIVVERRRQDKLWGEQNHSPHEWLPILVEEVGEVSKAILENKLGEYRKEVIHVAAVAAQMAECFDRKAENLDDEKEDNL